MKKSVFFGALTAATLTAGLAGAATLDDVKSRGELICGVNTGLVGFAAPDANGNWSGFDVAVCQAVAAAVLGDPSKVKYVPTSGQTRFTALGSGEVDLLARNTTWTFSRDTDLKLQFTATNYYDGQGFMVRKDSGVTSAKELDGASICIQTGTTTELNLADYFKANNMSYQPITVDSNAEGEQQFLAGACDAYTTDASGLAATRAAFANPSDYVILPEIISKEPLAPAVRQGDDQWTDIVRWTVFALIAAEEYGVTSANIDELAKGTDNPEVNRLLGTEGDLGAMIGLDKTWAVNAIKANGNYGEIFAATIGEQTPIGLARGLNAQWTQGGLMYAPPFR
ncbi:MULTISPECIES: amino acid ABC transporter substrate-binding protein [Thioclava]|uniref:Amino acid ABC transporter substrate-binding protein n=1 Tax=Thioclava nitratireducens TaxID=1915078 RepID=A0ABN4X7F0_9RHOB|nr:MULTISPECIES: amino acid ABC transporter substrate-binding protein [Thioclava]AQS47040.1 amino acid ABC transporter substrate-binding protein [Thioclava nitratireducens]OWY00993.1 amino acid ABC transporter substrate-binding protein [Thioclava sp. IC9]OWY01101.1 amino acid ABC transporter substrate-binding protein [Thioclava sp. F1Mire-8]OWY08678.1 amino acid ABC transporter substrate-binding protein [Thioclava sp. F42-5]OWY11839.1 amino acid ABC transporter substrate-binding protein [Thioc